MKRLLLTVLAALAGTFAVHAQSIRDLDIRAVLRPDGSARVTQVWDVSVVRGTEWYIPINNLGEMSVTDLSVSENGQPFVSEGNRWDVDRSLEEKTGRCGIVEKRDGVELCWGQGSYGPHVWTAEFTVHGLVQAFSDADGFNFMFVNPSLVAPPQHVKITLVNGTGGPEWTYDNTRVWGFGSYGDINVEDGAIVYESLEPYSDGSSAIILTRFEKGLFQPEVARDMSFDELREKAMKGSSYGENDKEETFFKWLMALLFGGALFASLRAAVLQALGYKYKKSMYGKTKITEWFREAPLGGNLFASSYVLDNGWRFAGPASSKNLIGALFLRWILDGKVKVVPDPDKPKRVNLAFTPGLEFEDDVEGALYRMALEASGGNLLLESGEFEKWSERHYKQFLAWPDRAKARGRSYLHEKNYLQHTSTTNKDGGGIQELPQRLHPVQGARRRGSGPVEGLPRVRPVVRHRRQGGRAVPETVSEGIPGAVPVRGRGPDGHATHHPHEQHDHHLRDEPRRGQVPGRQHQGYRRPHLLRRRRRILRRRIRRRQPIGGKFYSGDRR